MSKLEKALLAINIAIYISIFLFSFTQVDLNLTLFQYQPVNQMIKVAQNLGYFNRELNTFIYITIIITAFTFYIINLIYFFRNKISKKYLLTATVLNVVILLFSYPFLSYDIFNYIFDAKIIGHYGLSPYSHKPLDFPNDPYLRFMRWTHRYSPYGPLWLIYSLIPYYLGLGKFILTLLAFKLFIGFFHILNVLIILKILKVLKSQNVNFFSAVYALNPVLLLEGVANAHNDILMAFFILTTVYFYLINKSKLSFIFMTGGILIKYISLLFVPSIILSNFKKIEPYTFTLINFTLLAFFTIAYSTISIRLPFFPSSSVQNQFQPWYLFWTLPLVCIYGNFYLTAMYIALSFGATLRYIPYLYYGDWSHAGTQNYMTAVTIIPVLCVLCLYFIKNKQFKFRQVFQTPKP